VLSRLDSQSKTLLQISKMLQIQGAEGEAGVVFCKPLITKDMGYYQHSYNISPSLFEIN
jgi:hypothetical protein